MLLNAFPGVGLGDGAVLVVGVDSGLGDGENRITASLRSLSVWEDDSRETRSSSLFMASYLSAATAAKTTSKN